MKNYIKPALTAVPVYVECAMILGSDPTGPVNPNPNDPVNPPVNPNPRPNGIPVTDGTYSYDAPVLKGIVED